MAKKISRTWQGIWTNLQVSSSEHRDTAAAFVLIHEQTGYYYFGATSSLYSHFQVMTSLLRLGRHGSRKMQQLFNKSPRFLVSGIVTGTGAKGKADAEDIKQMWLAAHAGDRHMLNVVHASPKASKPVSWRKRALVVRGHPFPNPRAVAQLLGISEDWVKVFCDDPKTPAWQWA